MTPEEIFEYNKRCSEFLGCKFSVNEQYELPNMMVFPPKKNSNLCHTAKVCCVEDMQFHSDWNWITEVVEAIEKLKFRFEIALNEVNLYCILEERRFSYAINYHDCENYGEEMHLTKKEAVVQAINQFLIWYNENKTN